MTTEEVKNRIKEIVEDTAEQFVMEDLADPGVLARLAENLSEVSRELENDLPGSSKAAGAAAGILQQGAESGGEIGDRDLRSADKTISLLQELIRKDMDEDVLDFPAFGQQQPEQGGSSGQEGSEAGQAGGPAPGVDQDIMKEYVAQQESVLSEIESLVLSYEKESDSRVLADLKRLLHTAKGEAGVMGLDQIAKACHGIEDYIQEAGESIKADLLLEFKDWFEEAVASVRDSGAPQSAENLLEALKEEREQQEEETKQEQEQGQVPDAEEAPSAGEREEAGNQGDEAGDEGGAHEEMLAPVPIEDPEITADFISEANEHFQISDENLLTLESNPEDLEAVASIFRAFHTIKGTTSFLGLSPISELAHKAENLLDEVRKKNLAFAGPVVDATFNALDLLKTMTKDLENALAAGEDFVPDSQMPGVISQLKEVMSGRFPETVPGAQQEDEAGGGRTGPTDEQEVRESAQDEVPAGADEGAGAGSAKPAAANNGAQAQAGKTVKQTMKIDADRIDLLLETIGELVIVESIVTQDASLRQTESRELERNLSQLTKITRSLQDMGMSMRLIPIDNTFRKMGRLVRDLAKKSGKKIELSMEGRETELDKAMVEKLGDPLVHMVRNAVDHGIEHTPEDRAAAGKDPTGRIVLKAYHQGGNIHIEIKDDGRGLDRDAIAAKAVERGLVDSTDGMTDEEVFALIFEPGFSTAEKVTDVSGRGVGMDVVKSNIENMRGNVRISSEKGAGSTFTLVLPLTMAIIDGMIVRAGEEKYILPLLSIIESFQPTRDMISTVSGKGETVPFRNRLLPVFRLADLFGIDDAQTDPEKALLVVLEDAGRQVALMVDELLGQNQTVIKNLGEGLKDVEGIAGASIMPDGNPGLIIDVNGLIKMASG